MNPQETTPSTAGSRSGVPLAVFWVAAFLIVYVLSPGPVIKLCGKNPAVINVLYPPLIYLDENIPGVHRFYEWYGKLWGI